MGGEVYLDARPRDLHELAADEGLARLGADGRGEENHGWCVPLLGLGSSALCTS